MEAIVPRRSTEQIKAEIDKLAELVEIFENFNRRYHHPDFEGIEPLPTKDEWITRCREGGASWSEILAGYEQAANDTLAVFSSNAPDMRAYASALLSDFESRIGRPLFSVVSPPQRVLKAIAKRRYIENETEYYLVKEVIDDLSDDPQKTKLTQQLTECMVAFEMSSTAEKSDL
ncbi:MAG: hypothetical protein AAFR75_01270 [Pseudomonadota bacterium]